MRRAIAACSAAVLLLSTAACGDDGEGDGQAIDGVSVSGDVGEEPKVETTDAFDVFDPDTGDQVGSAREVVSGLVAGLRFLVAKNLMPTRIEVRERLGGLINVPFKFDFGGSQIIFFDREEDYSAEEALRAKQNVRAFRELTD